MGRSVRSGLEILSSLSVPAPAHHSAQSLSSVYPWSYYITSGSIAPTFLCGIALEKVADYITFIHQGKVLFCKTKDELRYNYGIIRCGAALFDQLDKAEILAYRKDDYQWNVLVADKEKARRKYKNAVVDDATIDDILLLYVKGEQAK